MKNIQSGTPGFVLTSMSISKNNQYQPVAGFQNPSNTKQQSTIAKFDYCLPPDEYATGEADKQTHAA